MYRLHSATVVFSSWCKVLLRNASDGGTQRLLLLFGCTLVALTAAIHISTRAVWGDEAITLLTLAGHSMPTWTNGRLEFYGFSSLQQILSTLTWHDFHPPLYFWLAEVWRHLTGPSLTAARSLSALCVLASMVVTYGIAGGWQMRFRALPALLFGFSGVSLMYAATARQYALAELLILLALYCGQRRSLWAGVVAALAVATHYYALLAIAPILAVQCVSAWKSQRRWSLCSALLFSLGVAALVPMLKVQAAARMSHYPTTAPLYREASVLVVGELVAGFPLSSKLWIAVISAALVGVGFILGTRRSMAERNLVPLIGFLFFSLAFLLLEQSSRKALPDNFPIPYYVGFCVPTFVFLISYGVEELPPLGLMLLPALLASALSWTDRGFPRSNVDQVVAELHHGCDSCLVVVSAVNARGSAAALLYRLRDVPVLVFASAADLPSIFAATSTASRIYFLPTSDTSTLSDPEAEFLQCFSQTSKLPSGAYLLARPILH